MTKWDARGPPARAPPSFACSNRGQIPGRNGSRTVGIRRLSSMNLEVEIVHLSKLGEREGRNGPRGVRLLPRHQALPARERVLFIDNLLVQNPLKHRDDFSGSALRHGNLNSLFQAAFHIYLPLPAQIHHFRSRIPGGNGSRSDRFPSGIWD